MKLTTIRNPLTGDATFIAEITHAELSFLGTGLTFIRPTLDKIPVEQIDQMCQDMGVRGEGEKPATQAELAGIVDSMLEGIRKAVDEVME